MFEHIYNIVGEEFIIILIALFAHYVFLEPKWKKWQYYFHMVCVVILIVAECVIKSEDRVLLSVLIAGLNISIARKKHPIRGFLLVFPIMGLCIGVIMPIMFLPEWLFQVQGEGYDVWVDVITFFFMVLFFWRGKRWRERFEMELQYRKLQKWESRLLIFVGLILFLSIIPLDSFRMTGNISEELNLYIIFSVINAMVLTITVITLVMQGNKRAYYANIAALNEGYLHAEMKHFQAYQETQTETRRIRHDMKNHLQAMLYLARAEKYSELEKYLEDVSFAVMHIDQELHCGNYLADAICNEKNQVALRKGIAFEIEGKMSEDVKVEPVDICTIFANALDNAIEALESESQQSRWIKLLISCQGDIVYLRFTNPVLTDQKEPISKRTSKKDAQNHGFGLQNVRIAVEKYHGEINTSILEENGNTIFSLEIMLFNH